MNATFDLSKIDLSTFEKIFDYIQNNQIISLIIGLVIAGGIIFLVAKKLMTMSVRILLGILTIVFTLFMGPKLNTFIMNKMNQYGLHGIMEQKLSQIVDGDIETKVRREYEMETGRKLTEDDRELIERLKSEAYVVNPNLNDELNMIVNAGMPQGFANTILLNIEDHGTPDIEADNFADFAAKFMILRITTLMSYFVAFSVATKLFGE